LGLSSFNRLFSPKADCRYITEKRNVIAIGNSGTGKTFLAIALGDYYNHTALVR